eukprot:TRINITY_DN18412_c0_g1_i1.p1 TRINITY_DN18412_c0_g1~~TRINITY_DN18412_c0_g1_i1.p1  ORF type:complete len:538 (+),score=95.08 TRINITY_DN18412_c0_g1_i1:61-1614(+)
MVASFCGLPASGGAQRYQSQPQARSRGGDYRSLLLSCGVRQEPAGATSGRRVVAPGGVLVASYGHKRDLRQVQWHWDSRFVIDMFGYIGIPQLFLGVVEEDDEHYAGGDGDCVPCTRLVCRRWADWACQLEVLDFTAMFRSVDDKLLRNALPFFKGSRGLLLSGCRNVRFVPPLWVTPLLTTIEVLHLARCSHLTDYALGQLAVALPNLRDVCLASCIMLAAVPLPSGCCVEVLDLSSDQRVGDATVSRLCRELPQLRELFLSNCALSAPEIGSPTLEVLCMDGCEGLSWAAALGAIRRCPRLSAVSFGDCDAMFEQRAKTFPRFECVTELCIPGIGHDDSTIESALQGMPSLVHCDVSRSETVCCPALSHPRLEVLVLNMCPELCDAAVATAAKKMPKLRHLSCNRCDSLRRPQIVSGSLLLLDLSSCPGLLRAPRTIGGRRAPPPERWLFCPNLLELYLGHNSAVTDAELEAAVAGAPELTELNLYLDCSILRCSTSPSAGRWTQSGWRASRPRR